MRCPSAQRPHEAVVRGKAVAQIAKPQLAPVQRLCRCGSRGVRRLDQLIQMCGSAKPPASDHRDRDPGRHLTHQIDILACAATVPINRGQDNFTCPAFLGLNGPVQNVATSGVTPVIGHCLPSTEAMPDRFY